VTDNQEESNVEASQPEAAGANGQVQEVDLASIDPAEIGKVVAQTSDEQLAEGMSGPLRSQVIGEVFSRMKDFFKPENAAGQEAVVHWKITGGPEGSVDHWEIVVRNGELTVTDSPTETPRVTLTMDGVSFLKLVTGAEPGPTMFMSGKLQLEGDMMFAANIQSMFTLPGS
jgi:putative sterol carrier protein